MVFLSPENNHGSKADILIKIQFAHIICQTSIGMHLKDFRRGMISTLDLEL